MTMAVLYCIRCGALAPSGHACPQCGSATLCADQPRLTVPRELYDIHCHEWRVTRDDWILLHVLKIDPECKEPV
jgi:hypothetical protein